MLIPTVGANVDIHLNSGLMLRGVVMNSNTTYVELGKQPAIHQSDCLATPFEIIQINTAQISAVGIRK